MMKATWTQDEVCAQTGLEPHILRFWEGEFPQLRPRRNSAGQRVYRERDVDIVTRLKAWIYDEGLAIPAARRRLKEEYEAVAPPPDPEQLGMPFLEPAEAPATAKAEAPAATAEPAPEPVPALSEVEVEAVVDAEAFVPPRPVPAPKPSRPAAPQAPDLFQTTMAEPPPASAQTPSSPASRDAGPESDPVPTPPAQAATPASSLLTADLRPRLAEVLSLLENR
jgi:DNA-binding transcriptional MerR regulator